MDPVTWTKAKGPAYVVTQVVATICVVVLIAFTVMRIVNPSYEPIIDPITFAIGGIALSSLGAEFDKSDNSSNCLNNMYRLGRRSK